MKTKQRKYQKEVKYDKYILKFQRASK